MVLAAQATCLGAMVFSYFNDSLFWVADRNIVVRQVYSLCFCYITLVLDSLRAVLR